jgi:hypothetical protein
MELFANSIAGRTRPASSANRHYLTFRYSLSGEPILLPVWISTHIRSDTNLEWYLPYVAEAINWPMSHIALFPEDHPDDIVWMLPPTNTLISRLFPNGGDVVLKVMKMPPPAEFGSYGGCACDFGSCCKLCTAPEPHACCGQDACCRCGDCGHWCCEEIVKGNGASVPNMTRVCQRPGCLPE